MKCALYPYESFYRILLYKMFYDKEFHANSAILLVLLFSEKTVSCCHSPGMVLDVVVLECRHFVIPLLSFRILTHYQTTNFRLFQTERVCRRQFQIWRKWQKAIQTGRKHWEKEKLLVTSNFFFSHSVFKRLVSQGRQKVSLCGNGSRHLHQIWTNC